MIQCATFTMFAHNILYDASAYTRLCPSYEPDTHSIALLPELHRTTTVPHKFGFVFTLHLQRSTWCSRLIVSNSINSNDTNPHSVLSSKLSKFAHAYIGEISSINIMSMITQLINQTVETRIGIPTPNLQICIYLVGRTQSSEYSSYLATQLEAIWSLSSGQHHHVYIADTGHALFQPLAYSETMYPTTLPGNLPTVTTKIVQLIRTTADPPNNPNNDTLK